MSDNKLFRVYKSSAGSGKTYTLVKEYLKLALATGQKDYYRYILAITFTNKAAEEMKARVFLYLKDLSCNLTENHKNYTLQKRLSEDLKIPIHELQFRAEIVLTHMLHHYSDIAISTIDKFTHRVIRTFAHDLHLPLNFEIEMDSDSLLNEAVELLLSKVGEDKNLTNHLVEFAQSKADDDKNWNIENDIFSFAANLLKEENENFLNSLRTIEIQQFFDAIKIMRSKKNEFLKSLQNIGFQASQLINNIGINNASFYQGDKGIGTYFYNLSQLKNFLPNSYVLATIKNDKWTSGKATEDQIASIEGIKDVLTKLFNQAQEIIVKKYKEYLAIEELLKNIHSMALLQELENILAQIKTEKNILPIAEFNKLISNIVQHESAPFIYERIGEKYHHFLIDEFQDTSVMQWQNILPLIHNSLSNGYFNLIVGDGKQSIYRWRGGEVEQFSQLPKLFSNQELTSIQKERQQALISSYDEEKLNQNWRSKKEIVEFNNEFFKFLSQNYLGEFSYIYDDLKQEYNKENSGAWITLDIIKKEKKNSNFEDSEDFLDNEEKALEKTLNYIHKHLELGYQQKDICILCRTNLQGQIVADYLIRNDFNVISPDSLLIAYNPHVKFIINTLSYAVNPNDKISQVKILEYLIDGNYINHPIPEELYLQISKQEKTLEEVLKDYNINFSKQIILQQSLFDAVEDVVRLFNLNKTPDPYIQFFLNAVFEFSTKKNNSIHDFLDWFEKYSEKLSITVPEGSDAIQIMTIHKSKGLEFPVVIMPFVNEIIKLSKSNLWVEINDEYGLNIPVGLISSSGTDTNSPFYNEKQHEKNKSYLDIINLLYVAFTRAVDALHLILVEIERADNTFPWFKKYLENKVENYNSNSLCIEISPLKNSFSPHKKEEKETVKFKKIISSPWYEKLKLSFTAPEAWNIDNPDEASQYGKLFHDIIAAVNTKFDLDEVLEKFEFEGNINSDEVDKIKSEIQHIVNHALLNKYFTNEYQAINEVDIIDESGSTYRPDKIFVKDNQAIILDFKTGVKKASHIEQIEKYGNLLQNLGFKVSEKYLYYTQNKEIINV
jgi:ATP-dependent exoDNAse (exonuclease V) beta subunit